MSWVRELDGVYSNAQHRMTGMVCQQGETWQSRVYVDGFTVYHAEWSCREDAIRNCGGAMSRACFLRRFEKNPPTTEDDDSDDDEDDDE